MIKKLLLLLIVPIFLFGQVKDKKKIITQMDDETSTGYALYNAVTGTHILTSTKVFLYGSYTETPVPKDSTGTRSASKYIVVSGLFNNEELLTNGGFRGVNQDSLENYWHNQYDQFYNVSGNKWNFSSYGNTIEQVYPYEVPLEKDHIYKLFLSIDPLSTSGKVYFLYNTDKWFLWNIHGSQARDTTLTIYNKYDTDNMVLYVGDESSSTGATIDSISLKTYGYKDSVRTLARVIDLNDLKQGQEYTYYASALQPNGRYSKGADSTFITPLPKPLWQYINDGTMGIKLNWFDTSTNEDGFIIYENGIAIDTVSADSTSYCLAKEDITMDSQVNLQVASYTQYTISKSDTATGTAYFASGDSTLVDSTVASINNVFNGIYKGTGANYTGWTTSATNSNTLTNATTGGNPDSCYVITYGGNDGAGYFQRSFTATDTLWCKFDIYIPAIMSTASSTTNAGLVTLYNSSTANYGLEIDGRSSTGNLNNWRVYVGGGTTTTNTNGYGEDGWRTVIMKYQNPGGANGKIQVWANGTSVTSQTGLTLTQATLNGIRVGNSSWGVAIDNNDYIKFDNITLANDSLSLYGTADTTWNYEYDSSPVAFDCGTIDETDYWYDSNGYPILDRNGYPIILRKEN